MPGTLLNAIDIVMSLTPGIEGEKLKPYDDATGLPVVAPKGNLTWGRGFNLMQCGSSGLFDVMERYLHTVNDARLKRAGYQWYIDTDPIRQAVLLYIDYNAGENGLLHFPLMLHYISIKDWASAAMECKVKNPELAHVYLRLSEILATGEIHP